MCKKFTKTDNVEIIVETNMNSVEYDSLFPEMNLTDVCIDIKSSIFKINHYRQKEIKSFSKIKS
jgi:hypothetical protein